MAELCLDKSDVPMPVTRRKLATATAPRPHVAAPISITRHQPAIQPAQQTTDQRGMNLKVAAKFAGVSVWQVRRWIRDGELKSAIIGNKHIIDRFALDRLLDGLFQVAI